MVIHKSQIPELQELFLSRWNYKNLAYLANPSFFKAL
jgi:hypothetical protein